MDAEKQVKTMVCVGSRIKLCTKEEMTLSDHDPLQCEKVNAAL